MTDPLLHQSHLFIDGQFVSAKVSQIVEAIKEYEPELDVEWIPPAAREGEQAAFRIVHRPVGKAPYVAFYVKSEDEFDERVLMKIIHNDQRNGKRQLSDLETWEETQRLLQRQKWLDELEEANDIAAHVLRSPLNVYKVDKNTVIRDYGNTTRR